MEQEPPDNEMPVEDERATVWHDGEALPSQREGEHLEGLAAEYQAPIPGAKDEQNDGLPSAERPLEVVDPYTAAPPATVFTETVAPLGQPARDDENPWHDPLAVVDPFVPIPYVPSTQDETIRRSGLAWSAGIAFFGSVAFTLFLGWLAVLVAPAMGTLGMPIAVTVIALLFAQGAKQRIPRPFKFDVAGKCQRLKAAGRHRRIRCVRK